MKEEGLAKAVADTFLNDKLRDSVSDASLDTLEVGIDLFIDNEIIKELPLVKYFYTAGKLVISIHDQYTIRKIASFFKHFEEKDFNLKQIEKIKKSYEKNTKEFYNHLDFLIASLDRLDRDEKTKLLAEITILYLNEKISKNELNDLFSIVERLIISDLNQLSEFYSYEEILEKNKGVNIPHGTSFNSVFSRVDRLLSLGLLNSQITSIQVNKIDYVYTLNNYGKILGAMANETGYKFENLKEHINYTHVILATNMPDSAKTDTD